MRLPPVVLLLAWVAGVCVCRPEGLPPLPEDVCGAADDECVNLARTQHLGDRDDQDQGDDDMHDGMGDMEGIGEMGDMADVGDAGDVDDTGDGDDAGDVDETGEMDEADEVDEMDDMDKMDEADDMEEMADMLEVNGTGDVNATDTDDMDVPDADDDGVTDDEVEYVFVEDDDDDDDFDDDDTTNTNDTDPSTSPFPSDASTSTPSSPTGPPKPPIKLTPLDDPNNETTNSTSTDSTNSTSSTIGTPETVPPADPTGPPVSDVARQGSRLIGARRPKPGPFPTPYLGSNMVGLVGFTLRGANNTRKGRVGFKNIMTNLGGGWRSSNTFRAPLYGFYYFSVHATSTRNSSFKLAISVNGKPQVFAYASRGYRHGCVSAVLRLKSGNRVSLDLQRGSLFEPRGTKDYTVFTGIIVSIDLRQQGKDRGDIRFWREP